MDLLMGDRAFPGQVPPFGHPRITGYLLLPVAFRSLSRPSSAPSAQAFSLCSFLLDLLISLLLGMCSFLAFCFLDFLDSFPLFSFQGTAYFFLEGVNPSKLNS